MRTSLKSFVGEITEMRGGREGKEGRVRIYIRGIIEAAYTINSLLVGILCSQLIVYIHVYI